MQVLVIDGANVVGSRPDGWWRDRAGAARRLHDHLIVADLCYDEVVLVLEGKAREGPGHGLAGSVRTVHAPGSGDDALVGSVTELTAADPEGHQVTVVTADRGLRARVEAVGARCRPPAWLLDQLGGRG